MIEIRKTEIFAKWLDELHDIRARARILVRIERLADGNPLTPSTEFIGVYHG
jgi:putative component of toxin-antitoxin plasmid stabilization module